MLLGELPLSAGRRVSAATVIGALEQRRAAYDASRTLLGVFALADRPRARGGTDAAREVRSGRGPRGRPCASLSPGERTRARLAELQARGVNLLVLDEPTNHLDLEAVEQLETALAGYDGAAVVVSHDRRFLERIAPTREVALGRSPAPRAAPRAR